MTSSRHQLRRVLSALLRPIPTVVLTDLASANLRPLAVLGRAGLQNRPVRIPAGVAAGMTIDVGWGETAAALGRYEPEVQRALASLLRSGEVVYDIGVHSGFIGLIAGRLCGHGGAVYGFEPDANNAALSRRNFARNGLSQAYVVESAVGSFSGTALLRRSPVLARHAIVDRAQAANEPDIVEVPLLTLDEFVTRPGVRPPDLVKIDVEGHEREVVAGMTTLLRDSAPTLLIEFDGPDRASALARADAVIELLNPYGYDTAELASSYQSDDFAVVHLVARPVPRRRNHYLPGERLLALRPVEA